jgi:hypothetical protein
MASTTPTKRAERMSDEAVKAKTGRTWDEWFAILDAAGAREMGHKEIVAYLSQQQGVGPWWQQMVTVTYEQARGRREKHQTASGYQASVTRTLAAPVDRVFDAWNDEEVRRKWLPVAKMTVRKATPGKSLRIVWEDGSRVDVNLYAKGEARSQVSVDQTKLPDAGAVARAKGYWKQALDRLQEFLEG